MTLKSLAHKDWPYAGTAHEWRGFVKDEKATSLKPVPFKEFAESLRAMNEQLQEFWKKQPAVYQKQNFGPELK